MNKKYIILTCIIAVVTFIIGYFIGDASAVNRVNKRIDQNVKSVTNDNIKTTSNQEDKPDSSKEKVYKLGEEGKSGNWSIKVLDAKEATTIDGTMYAAARDVTPKVMYINTKMFEDAGVKIPEDTWTIDDFLEAAQQLTKGSGADKQWGYYWANYADQTYALIAAFGGNMYSEDGTTSVFSSDPKTQEAMKFMYDLYNTYKVCPSGVEAKQFGDKEMAAFMANKVAMQIGGLSQAGNLAATGVEFTALPIPYLDGVSQTSSFVNTWVIPNKAKNPEASWKVVEFLSGKEGQQIALDTNMGLPASKDVDTTGFINAAPYNKYFVQALETAVPYPTHANAAAFQTMFVKECEYLWAGEYSLEEFANTVDEQSKSLLKAD